MNPVFIAALFTTARTWKKPKCPSRDEWVKNPPEMQDTQVDVGSVPSLERSLGR